MPDIQLYTSALCPFAHRVRLALAEKALQAEEIEIDLRNKPVGFLDVSPQGKVPVLLHNGRRLWESSAINEYLEEAFPVPPLLPKDPFLRAQARIWVTYADWNLYATTGGLLHSSNATVQRQALTKLADAMQFLESHAFAKRAEVGPYALGAVSLVRAGRGSREILRFPHSRQLQKAHGLAGGRRGPASGQVDRKVQRALLRKLSSALQCRESLAQRGISTR
jgi:glutathione S-transferase